MKLAIISEKSDLLRVIPFRSKSSMDFKISTLGNEFLLEYLSHELNPELFNVKTEITYHSSSNKEGKFQPGVVHVKERNGLEINYRYKFPKIVDCQFNNEFPVPLFKLSIASFPEIPYSAKSDHQIFDFSKMPKGTNTVEIYFTSKKCDISWFVNKWPMLNLLWSISEIDYLVKGVDLSNSFLSKLYNPQQSSLVGGYSFDDFIFLFKFYFREGINDNKITFYENLDYISLLGTSIIQLQDDATKQMLTKPFPAFAFDLDKQLNKGFPQDELDKWESYFRLSLSRVAKLDIKRKIFIIPQIDITLRNR